MKNASRELEIGFSPCPNDTFIFHAMLHGLIDTGEFCFVPHIDDVEALNLKAFEGAFPITKLSFYAYVLLKERYALLDSGSALGYKCGPLLVAKSRLKNLAEAHIAIPGKYTTAHMLLKLWHPEIQHVSPTRFDLILPGVQSGEFDAGLIIHEGRFIYPEYGCIKIIDLGEWWEAETRLPIPLGCIAIQNDPSVICHKEKIESFLRNSVNYAFENRDASREFIKSHAQEMDDTVIDSHINLYVNDFTISLGETGRKAVETLAEMAQCRKII
ncbi:1,4-dihydroxy-6-naphthoate synthase [Desulfonema magnum]|uniref:1,4-dihydroxy-6-naphtoate synthase n=1 Tax=Desulfonema magnum TaxID=45655 RepID=A0A975GQD4_9BACT|nr:1,4-dihydroxy-6-naphthoate synthase [Desulfonema magnum]QTA89774.1 Menaquinone biosynthesis family protein [Desulfonema magnum]